MATYRGVWVIGLVLAAVLATAEDTSPPESGASPALAVRNFLRPATFEAPARTRDVPGAEHEAYLTQPWNGSELVVRYDRRHLRVLEVTLDDERVYRWPGVYVVGHRGVVHQAPENTLPAIEKALDFGAHLVEIDIRPTKDRTLVLMHDPLLVRTTDGIGFVGMATAEDMAELDAGSWFDAEFAGTPVPTLAQALEAMRGRAVPDLDFKDGDVAALAKEVAAAGIEFATMHSGNHAFLAAAKAAIPGLQIRPTIAPGRPVVELVAELDPPIVNINPNAYSPELIRAIHEAGRLAMMNTMGGSTDNAAYIRDVIDAGADIIQSDYPDILIPMLREMGLYAEGAPTFFGMPPTWAERVGVATANTE